MSARTGESSKANSFQTIFGIKSGPGDFFTFKARRGLVHCTLGDIQVRRHWPKYR